jgi:hypothetical protein
MRKSPSAGNFCVSMHTRRPPATTNPGGGASGVRQRPPTRDSCRTLPPRDQPQFAPPRTAKILSDSPSSSSAHRDASHAAPIAFAAADPRTRAMVTARNFSTGDYGCMAAPARGVRSFMRVRIAYGRGSFIRPAKPVDASKDRNQCLPCASAVLAHETWPSSSSPLGA